MAKANRAYYPSEYKRRGYLGEGTKLILAGLNATTKPVLDRLMNATSFDSMYNVGTKSKIHFVSKSQQFQVRSYQSHQCWN